MKPLATALLLLALTGAPEATPARGAALERALILVPVPAEPSWQDLAFLAAVPAACRVGDGWPIVLAVDPAAPWRPELLDFLRRYRPERTWWVGAEPAPGAPEGLVIESLAASSAGEASRAIAGAFWKRSSVAVLCAETDRAGALAASALAARLEAPLFWLGAAGPSAELRARFEELGVRRVLFVAGEPAPELAALEGLHVEKLDGPLGVARELRRAKRRIDYLAAVNPNDLDRGAVRKLSLVGAQLAAGREGIVVPVAFDVEWKRRFAAELEEGAAADGASPRTGRIELANESFSFRTEPGAGGGPWTARIDRDGDGDPGGADEGPFRTGDTLVHAGRRWSVDLDVLEHERGSAVWLTAPAPADVRERLAAFRDAAGGDPTYLCLVGRPDAIPPAIVGDAAPIDADLVSDLPYGQTDDDPFVELAFSRFLAEDLFAATLLACRTFAYEDLRSPSWERSFATVGWEPPSGDAFAAVGFRSAGHLPDHVAIEAESPITEVAILAHGSHAMWTVLGAAYSCDSGVLLAPCFVDSSGCSTASLDQDAANRSVAARLLRNGAVAFAGNTRRGTAQQELFRSELRAALLCGETLGEANRSALNRTLVAVLEKGETHSGLYRYQLYSAAVYGDPAFRPHLPARSDVRPARVELRGVRATVRAPSRWWRESYAPVDEWGCALETLYFWRGAGVGVESWWYGPEKRNEEALWFTAEVRTKREVTGLEAQDEVAAPLGWSGKFFLDEHADGTRSVFWRTRLIDGDKCTGEVRAEIDRLSFRLLEAPAATMGR